MSQIDLVFEGGGAKGIVFTGALEVLLKDRGHSHARLLGTSAGAITAVSLAAGYTPDEMLDALAEKDSAGKPVFASFLGDPAPFDEQAIRQSAIRKMLAALDLPLVPDFLEGKLDDWIASRLAKNESSRHLFSFVERGGWFSADPFVRWMEGKLDQDKPDGSPRGFSQLTLKEFFDATGVELTLVAADTSWARMLLLNHRTAPDCPVKWATRMSMSVPLLWQEVEWQEGWGAYHTWNPGTQRLEPNNIAGHAIVDGGLLSNFPISLFLSDRDDVAAIVGPAQTKNVLGLLIDESIPVSNQPTDRVADAGAALTELNTFKRLRRLVNTATSAHDNTAIAAFARYVVRLPAGGYGTIDFDLTDAEREALIQAGREAMKNFLAQQSVLDEARAVSELPVVAAEMAAGDPSFSIGATEMALANEAALTLLQR